MWIMKNVYFHINFSLHVILVNGTVLVVSLIIMSSDGLIDEQKVWVEYRGCPGHWPQMRWRTIHGKWKFSLLHFYVATTKSLRVWMKLMKGGCGPFLLDLFAASRCWLTGKNYSFVTVNKTVIWSFISVISCIMNRYRSWLSDRR